MMAKVERAEMGKPDVEQVASAMEEALSAHGWPFTRSPVAGEPEQRRVAMRAAVGDLIDAGHIL